MVNITQNSDAIKLKQLRRFIFNWLFDGNRKSKLEAIAIAKEMLDFSESEIGYKLGVSQQKVSQLYLQHKKNEETK